MRRRNATREWIAERCDNALMYDGLDRAVIGVAHRCGQPSLVVYDRELIARVLVKRDGLSEDDADEWIDHNIVGGWVGPMTPIVLEALPSRGRKSRNHPSARDAEVCRLRSALEQIAANKDEPYARDFAVEVLNKGFSL